MSWRLLRRLARPLAGALLVLFVVLGGSTAAGAHAVLEASSPPSGAQLDTAPRSVTLDFDEPVGIDLGYVRLSRSGRSIDIGAARHLAGRPDVVTVDLPDLGPGLYVVGYRVVSEDGHPVSGDIAFRIGAGSAAVAGGTSAPAGDRSVGIAYGLVRMLAYLALVVAVGVPVVVFRVRPAWWVRCRLPVAAAGAVLAVAALVQLVLAGAYLAGTSWADVADPGRWGDVAGTSAGAWWAARAAAAAVLAAIVLAGTRRDGRPRPTVLAAWWASSGLVLWTFVVDGHAAAGRWAVMGKVATFVHLLAMAAWLGGLLLVALAAPGLGREDAAAVGGRWSPLAAGSVAAVAVSGAAQAWRTADGWDLGSTYQRLLLAKTIGVLAMLGLAVVARRLLSALGEDQAAPQRLRRGVATELAVGVVVLVVTTVLVQTPPTDAGGGGAEAGGTRTGVEAEATTAVPASWSTTVEQGGRTVQLHIDGATVGRHELHVVLDDAASPLTDPVTARARLLLQEPALGPFPVLLTPAGDRAWTADGLEITRSGTWRLEVIIDDPASSIRFSTDLPVAG